MKARAFCPGHVTAFFQVFIEEQELLSGSRGAGMCLAMGATTEVRVSESSAPEIVVVVDGRELEAEVTRSAVSTLMSGRNLEVHVNTRLDLPQGQGFGMSAAGSLSAALALAEILGESRQRAFEAAHIAEVRCRCGLGDVPALHRGGITVRTRHGLPPAGEVLGIEGTPEVVLCVVGGKKLTREVLADREIMSRVNDLGGQCVDALVREPTLGNLMTLAGPFARDTGLASREVRAAMDCASDHGFCTMAMIGNAVFAVGDTPSLVNALSEVGDVYLCEVDPQGPRII